MLISIMAESCQQKEFYVTFAISDCVIKDPICIMHKYELNSSLIKDDSE